MPDVDGYHLPDMDYFIKSDEYPAIVAALRTAGITPEEFNQPEEPEPNDMGLKPEARFVFDRHDDGTLTATRHRRYDL